MTQQDKTQRAQDALRAAVEEAAAFFETVHPDLFDGYRTAHDVLAHLVFWMCEHVRVAEALVAGSTPTLSPDSIPALNEAACAEHRTESMPVMRQALLDRYEKLDTLLGQLPDWSVNFPIKAGSQTCTVDDRIFGLTAHLHYHITTLRRAAITTPDLARAVPA